MSILENLFIYVVPLIFIVLFIISHLIMDRPLLRKCKVRLKRTGITWISLERMAIVCGILSIWLVMAQNYLNSLKEDEVKRSEFVALMNVFNQTKKNNIDLLDYIIQVSKRNFVFIEALEFSYLDVQHIEILSVNKYASSCFDLVKLFQLKHELSRLNNVIPSFMELSGIGAVDVLKPISRVYDSDKVAQKAIYLYEEIKPSEECQSQFSLDSTQQ